MSHDGGKRKRTEKTEKDNAEVQRRIGIAEKKKKEKT
jgi:hypothetical protein